jgi:hypothetical protein
MSGALSPPKARFLESSEWIFLLIFSFNVFSHVVFFKFFMSNLNNLETRENLLLGLIRFSIYMTTFSLKKLIEYKRNNLLDNDTKH